MTKEDIPKIPISISVTELVTILETHYQKNIDLIGLELDGQKYLIGHKRPFRLIGKAWDKKEE